jgi:tRNA1(Val) A37 N6-methylase TrmN6
MGAPPFMPLGSGILPGEETRAAGRFELRGGVRDYAETAARHLAPSGIVVVLMDGLDRSAERAKDALAAVGLHTRQVIAVHPRPDEPPTYRIFVASPSPDGARGEETLCMRKGTGEALSPEYSAVRDEMCLP